MSLSVLVSMFDALQEQPSFVFMEKKEVGPIASRPYQWRMSDSSLPRQFAPDN